MSTREQSQSRGQRPPTFSRQVFHLLHHHFPSRNCNRTSPRRTQNTASSFPSFHSFSLLVCYLQCVQSKHLKLENRPWLCPTGYWCPLNGLHGSYEKYLKADCPQPSGPLRAPLSLQPSHVSHSGLLLLP